MSTTVRSNTRLRPSGGNAREPLGARAVRVRNACVCREAARLGLAMPTDSELRDIPAAASLGEAVAWWRARATGAAEVTGAAAGVSLMLRTAVVVGVTLMGLVFSYGQAQ